MYNFLLLVYDIKIKISKMAYYELWFLCKYKYKSREYNHVA